MLLINRNLIRLAHGLWGWILSIVLVRLLTLIGMTWFSRIVAGFLGELTNPEMTMAQAGHSLLVAGAMALLTLFSQLAQGELEFRCTAKARTMLRTSIFSRVLELDAGNVEKIGPVSAITSSVDAVESMQVYFSIYLPSLIFSVIAPLYLFFALRGTDVLISVLLLSTALILLPVNNVFRGRIENLRKTYWRSVEDMTACFLDSLRGLTTLKLFERSEDRKELLSEKAEKLNRDINAFMRVNFTSFLVTEGLIYTAILASVAVACVRLASGTLDLGAALTVLLLSYSFFGSIRALMGATHSALTAVAAAGKVEEIFKVDTKRPYDPDIPVDPAGFDGIELKNVEFRYEGRDDTLSGISIKIPRGRVTAIAGLSGCGKSTIASLVMKFIDPAAGRILIEGRDYESFRPEDLRRHIVMVPQTVSLFTGSIRDNLKISKKDASDQEMWASLEDAALADFVRHSPDGLDTQVGDAGSRLSGGQKQKIGIARALLSGAEYVILDEATSSVDIESEQEIWKCIGRLSETRTILIISHRMSAIQDADCIYMIEHGRIREKGCHENLLACDGLYAELYRQQASGSSVFAGGEA